MKNIFIQKAIELLGVASVTSIAYQKRNNVHIFEIKPLSVFENDNEYMCKELYIEKSLNDYLIEHNPKEEIVFVSEDSLTQIQGTPKFKITRLNK